MVEWFFNYSTRRQCMSFLSSLVVLFEGNLLEWGQLFSGEVLWWGGNYPWGQLSRGQFSSGGIIRGAIFLELIYTMLSRQSSIWLFIHFYYSHIMKTFSRSFLIHIHTSFQRLWCHSSKNDSSNHIPILHKAPRQSDAK